MCNRMVDAAYFDFGYARTVVSYSVTFVFIDIIYLHNKVLPHYVSSPLNKYFSLWLGWFRYVWDTYLEIYRIYLVFRVILFTIAFC